MNRTFVSWAAWALVGVVCVGSVEAAPSSDAQRCEAAKTVAAGRHAACLLKVNAKLVLSGEAATATSYDKCNEKMAKAWLKAETSYGVACPTTGDETGMASLIDAVAVYLSDHLAGPIDTCTLAQAEAGLATCTVTDCSGTPTDTQGDPSNCGSCGNVCSNAGATPACSDGVCTIGSCDLGFLDCDSSAANGCEVFAVLDPSNCGGCGLVCSLPNAVEGCSFGICGISSCEVGYGDCDGNPANGCEAAVTSDPNNCGSCASVCSLPNAQENCTASTCGVQSCDISFANCNGNDADGCEVGTSSDPLNCGFCGLVCPGGAPHCSAGVCVP